MFNLPSTHEIVLDKISGTTTTNIVSITFRLKGDARCQNTHRELTESEQLERIAKFWAFLMIDEDDAPRSSRWQYVIPGYTAYFFWANALLSRYCDFWGVD